MLLGVWLVALAAGGGSLSLNVVGTCPDEASVRRLLDELVPGDVARAATVSVSDRGAWYGLSVNGEPTTLSDASRDCAARAREAAILVAADLRSAHSLVLGPPSWTVEKGFVFDFASFGGSAVSSPGAEVRVAWGSRALSVFGAAGARGPATLELERGWAAELLRFPFDAGARLTLHGWRLRPWVGLGPTLTITSFLGEELLQVSREWRVDPGALLNLGATLPITKRIGVAAALSVRWQPRRYDLAVLPEGKVAETPAWWLGLSLNYTVDSKLTSP